MTYWWANVPEEGRNLDFVSDELLPRDGCPRCGSVWVEAVAVGTSVERLESKANIRFPWTHIFYEHDARLHVFDERFKVFLNAVVPIDAVRLVCADGHVVEWSGRAAEQWRAGGAMVEVFEVSLRWRTRP
jgi:hypothetical protein